MFNSTATGVSCSRRLFAWSFALLHAEVFLSHLKNGTVLNQMRGYNHDPWAF